MPIPPTAPPDDWLSIRELRNSRWEATCGRCLKLSAPVGASDAAQAWAELQRLGWARFVSPEGGHGYAICPACDKKGLPEVPRRGARRKRK